MSHLYVTANTFEEKTGIRKVLRIKLTKLGEHLNYLALPRK